MPKKLSNNIEFTLPIIGFAGYSGAGKTTLLEKLIGNLRERSLRIGLIKHAHHQFDIDHPGKDSYRLRKAGAVQTLVASAKRWALITETKTPESEPDLTELLSQLNRDLLDLVLIEGFKHASIPRIEVHRQANNKPFLYVDDPHIIALATDITAPGEIKLPVFNLNDIQSISDFIVERLSHRA